MVFVGRIYQEENLDPKEDFYLPEEVTEWIGLKKSEYLSKIIIDCEPDDFSFEEYHRFEDRVAGTLSTPDRVVQYVEDSYPMRTFVKSYEVPEFFHQVVIGVVIPEQDSSAEIFIPILIFVSRKEGLVKLFTRGENIRRPTLN